MLISNYHKRQQLIADKKRTILHFLRQETWSSAEVLRLRLRLSTTATYKTLTAFEREGIITSHYVPELKYRIWGITPTGLFYAWDDDELMENRPSFQTSKIKPVMIRHHLDLQLARLQAENQGWHCWMLAGDLPRGINKRPDAVATNTQGDRIAIELERTVKTRKRYEVIFSNYLQAVKRREYHSVHYLCPDQQFAKRLTRLFSTISTVPVAGERVQLNEKHRAKFSVHYLNNWPPHFTQES